MSMRIGHGYDVHRLVEGRALILGGVEIPHTTGLLGHSDADVLTHAIMDALLGAVGLWDIGHAFPDSDMAYKDISSMVLFERVMEMIREQGFAVENITLSLSSISRALRLCEVKISCPFAFLLNISNSSPSMYSNIPASSSSITRHIAGFANA